MSGGKAGSKNQVRTDPDTTDKRHCKTRMFPHVTIDIIEEMHISWSKLYYEYTLYDRFALVLKLFSLDDLTGKQVCLDQVVMIGGKLRPQKVIILTQDCATTDQPWRFACTSACTTSDIDKEL